MIRFLSLLLLGLCGVCRHVVVFGLSMRLYWHAVVVVIVMLRGCDGDGNARGVVVSVNIWVVHVVQIVCILPTMF